MKKNLLLAAFYGGMVILTGCAPTVAEIVEMYNKDLVAGKFDTSMPHMQELIKDDEDNSHEDTPMWRLMVANARMLTGDTKAIEEFDAAEDVILKNDRNIKNYIKAMSINDKYLAFNPGTQDRVFYSLAKALMYIEKGNYNAGRTELNRMMQYQEFWLKKCREDIAESQKAIESGFQPENDLPEIIATPFNSFKQDAKEIYTKLLESDNVLGLILKNTGFDLKNTPEISKLKAEDYKSAYASHICGVIRMLNNDYGNGVDYLKDASKLKKQSNLIANDLTLATGGSVKHNCIWIYIEEGLCSVRQETRIDLPIALVPFAGNYVKYMGSALPKVIARANAADKYTVCDIEMEELENIDRLIQTEYNIYMRGAVQRELVRCLLKTLPQVAAGIVKDTTGPALVCSSIQYAAAAYALASTQADLRTWNVLPKRVMVQRVEKPTDGKLVIKADAETFEIAVPKDVACFDCKGSGKTGEGKLDCIKCKGTGKFAANNYIVWIRKVAKNSPFIHKVIAFPAK